MRLHVVLAIFGLAAAPLFAQATRRPAIVPAFTPREASPAFVVECFNTSASAVPFPTIRRIRLDGTVRERTGGIAGSLLSAPDEPFEVAPGASHRVLFVLVQDANAGSSSPGRGLEARVRQGMFVPVSPGTHRLAIECLGEWSDETTFAWSSDAPLGW
jgi:hypothetical protein